MSDAARFIEHAHKVITVTKGKAEASLVGRVN